MGWESCCSYLKTRKSFKKTTTDHTQNKKLHNTYWCCSPCTETISWTANPINPLAKEPSFSHKTVYKDPTSELSLLIGQERQEEHWTCPSQGQCLNQHHVRLTDSKKVALPPQCVCVYLFCFYCWNPSVKQQSHPSVQVLYPDKF